MESDIKEPGLWKIAKKRASFKKHFATYLIINGFFWLLWFFQGNPHNYNGVPWPVWPMLGWGIGLAFNYFHAYHGDSNALAEKEYEKLKRESGNRNQ